MKPMVILTGPTAVGKTELSIRLAKILNAEIISADSMQVYKKMDIGTAKIHQEEMEGVKHYLVDELDPREEFHVARFQQMAKDALEEIYAKGKIPLIVGGTGFYIQSLLYDIDFTDNDNDTSLRAELETFAEEHGAEALHEKLREVDPKSADTIHANNIKRVIRALEFYQKTGMKISEHNETERQKESPYQFVYFILNDDRKNLYRRIDLRVDQMIEAGLVAEVKALKARGYNRSMVSMQGLGYKEILAYLDGEYPLEEAVRILKRDTRHFAKRQLTWFRREQDVIWVDKEQFHWNEAEILEYMMSVLKERDLLG